MRLALFLGGSLLGAALLGVAALALWPLPSPARPFSNVGDIKRGAYLARLSGCVSCHTSKDGEPFAGGVALESPFGTFYAPNITPDPQTGIGSWSLADFTRAVRQGVAPNGSTYYPAFPFEFYAGLSDQDIADLWVALRAVPPSAQPSRPHQVGFPFNIRDGVKLWRTWFARPYPYERDPNRTASWNRGRFLVNGPAHCAACHAPRNLLGGLELEAGMVGAVTPDGPRAPSITREALVADGWTQEALVRVLRSGILPDGDAVGGSMAEVVHGGTSLLLTQHLEDIAAYLLDPQ